MAEPLDSSLIQYYMSDTRYKKLDELVILQSTASTNDYVLQILKQNPHKKMVCIAEHQTAGRGRHGRPWIDAAGSSALFSLSWHFDRSTQNTMGLSLAIAIALVQALIAYGIPDGLQVKWPNDVWWNNRKCAGILIESLSPSPRTCSVVIGVGINVQIPVSLQDRISQPWTDIATITQQEPDRNRLIGMVLHQLMDTLDLFSQEGLSPFMESWKKYDALWGQQVSLTHPQSSALIDGVMYGITPNGELILQMPDGIIQYFTNGEVSIRR